MDNPEEWALEPRTTARMDSFVESLGCGKLVSDQVE